MAALTLLAGLPGVGCGAPGEVEPQAPAAAAAAPAPPPAEGAEVELEPGDAIERQISPGGVHRYRLQLAAGDYFEVRVEQRGVDVGLGLLDPRGELTLEMDLPTADLGVEPLLGVAEQTGAHVVQVEAWPSEDAGGGYRITLAARRPAGAVERLRDRAARSFHRGEQLALERRHREALAPYAEALALWREAGDAFWEAETLDRLGSTHRRLDEWLRAADYHQRAVSAFERLGDQPVLLAVSSNHLAMDYFELGRMDAAIAQYRRTLELQQQLGDRRGQGNSLAALANIFKVQGETQKALDHFARALELLDRPEDLYYRAGTLHNLGTLYRRLGKRQQALDYLRRAERVNARLGDTRRQASSLSQIGLVALDSGDHERALRALRHALELRRQREDRRGEAATLRKIGSVLVASGELEEGRALYLEALGLLAELEGPRSEAALLTDLGELHNRLGRSDEALEYHRRSLAIHRRVGDPIGEAWALLGVAVAERGRGGLEAARAAGERALAIAEGLRLKPFSEDLRFSFFATVQRLFDSHIDLLMELDSLEPDAGHAARALLVSERARARSLLDLLAEAGAEIRDQAAPELLEQEAELQRLLNRSVERMEEESAGESRRAAATAEVHRALDRLDRLRADIRRQSPRYAALTQPLPLGVEEIQRQVLDPETVLLQYRLGRRRSFLWLVGHDELSSYELPPADRVERSVRQVHALLRQGARRESSGRIRALLCELGRDLLAPVAGRLGDRRLVIVPDGVLEYLPFGVLPSPDAPGGCLAAEPLVARHEIVHLPSASILAALRREELTRAPAEGLVAVLADPVFSAADERLTGRPAPAAGTAAGAMRGDRGTRAEAFRRLPHTRAEAEAILGLVPPDRAYRALDFEASKGVVQSGRLAGYRIVHFATHGVLDAERPELSGLVLSRVDRQGRPIEGLLRSHEIYNLELPADLVVLGGCETALGKEVRGEGLVGLTRGFMYAGAARVMVSLWKVGDRGTADLMEAFYRNLLQEQMPPAAALRRAQLELRARRPEPFHWAGFVVQGDWRPPRRPAVEGGSADGTLLGGAR